MVKVDFNSGDIFNDNQKIGKVFLYDENKYLVLSKIEIDTQYRGTGFGQQAMEQIVNHANQENKTLTLTPDDTWGSNKNKLIDVIFWVDLFAETERNEEKLDLPVIIMAGGKGTRMRPLTNVIPKPLIPIDDKTIAEHIIENFRKIGCNNFYFWSWYDLFPKV